MKQILLLLLMTSCSRLPTADPMLPPAASGTYFPPLTGQIWETVTPESLGWNVPNFNAFVDYAGSTNTTALIVLHRGRIVVERYWNGWNTITNSAIFSSTKTMVALMTGIAQERKLLTIDQKVSDFLGTGWSKAPVAKENAITIRHLLTMTSGLNDELLFANEAGTTWYYNTPAYHKLIYVLQTAYKTTSFDAFTKNVLWQPIWMQQSVWQVNQPNIDLTISCSGRDMARFGLLMLSGGNWNGVPVLGDAAYLTAQTTTAQPNNAAYGYLTWLNGKASYQMPSLSPATVRTTAGKLIPDAPADLMAALGANDKKIYWVKSRDLVVIRHGPSAGTGRFALSDYDDQFWKKLMAALN